MLPAAIQYQCTHSLGYTAVELQVLQDALCWWCAGPAAGQENGPALFPSPAGAAEAKCISVNDLLPAERIKEAKHLGLICRAVF